MRREWERCKARLSLIFKYTSSSSLQCKGDRHAEGEKCDVDDKCMMMVMRVEGDVQRETKKRSRTQDCNADITNETKS